MSVKVAVRVRPYNEREKKLGAKCCLRMKGPTTVIIDPQTKKDRQFTFDYSFWSHDGFEEKEDGILVGTNSKYDDQWKVYEQVLDNAWEGYHCCLFAYGQTGSGKSYSMIGYNKNIGIVPIACNEIFDRVAATKTDEKWYEVSCSMIEIYNENIHDLLIEQSERPDGGLKVRQSKMLGVYVQGLSKHPVDCYTAIEQLMEEGYMNRSIGATEMNQTSSRAHTIISIEFKQFELIDGQTTERFSVINLVDLAGSEKAKQTKATKARLKEGCMINLSLTTLGQVINTLAEKAMGKAKNTVVPYRESALTRILQNALGGNSKTIMICALSPASTNYEETLNTLRYAERAKKVKNMAVINESEQDKMIRELKQENETLKNCMNHMKNLDPNSPEFMTYFQEFMQSQGMEAPQQNVAISKETAKADINDIQQQIQDNEAVIKSQNTHQQILDQEKLIHEKKYDRTKPHLTNLNEDSQLSGKLYYSLDRETTPVHVGRKNGDPKPSIILGGIEIKKNHAYFDCRDHDKVEGECQYFIKASTPEALKYIFVNGKGISEDGMDLKHNDRIIFGNNTVLLFKYKALIKHDKREKRMLKEKMVRQKRREAGEEVDSDEEAKEEVEENSEDEEVEWEKAQTEKIDLADKQRKKEEEEQQKKYEAEQKKRVQEMNAKIDEEKIQADQKIKEKQNEFEQQMKEMEMKMQQMEESAQHQFEQELEEAEQMMRDKIERMEQERLERERQRLEELEEQEHLIKQRQKDNEILEKKLAELLPLINEANLCAKEFNKDVMFKTKLISKIPDSLNNSPLEVLKNRKTEINVKVFNQEYGTTFLWDVEKFNERLYSIRELVNDYFETNEIPQLEDQKDPFWDPPEPQLIGQGFYRLEPLAYLIDNPHVISLIGNDKTGVVGKLDVNIIPTDESGWDEPHDDILPESPEDLIDHRIDFAVTINTAVDLPEELCKDVYCEYSFYQDEQPYSTPIIPGKHQSPVFDYRYHHTVQQVTPDLIRYLKNDAICFKVYGSEEEQRCVNQNLSGSMGDSTNISNTLHQRSHDDSQENSVQGSVEKEQVKAQNMGQILDDVKDEVVPTPQEEPQYVQEKFNPQVEQMLREQEEQERLMRSNPNMNDDQRDRRMRNTMHIPQVQQHEITQSMEQKMYEEQRSRKAKDDHNVGSGGKSKGKKKKDDNCAIF